jgi:large subunit ribosomal protein L33
MAKPKTKSKKTTIVVRLVSTGKQADGSNSGFFYTTKRNPKTTTEKLEFRKYDPVTKKHEIFKERKESHQ